MDASLLELSKHINEELDLLDVTVIGLGMRQDIVQKHLKDNSKSITIAANKCFREWWSGMPDITSARNRMNEALEKTKKTQLKHIFNKAWS